MKKYNKPFVPKGRNSLPKELIQFGRHLVYSEGTKTEPYYVDDIKECISKKYNCQPNEIEIITVNKEKKSFNTISLVEYAENDVRERLKMKEKIDHVWIFYDKDSFPKDNFDNANQMINEKNDSKEKNIDGFNYEEKTSISWHSCWSNEAFELWLYLYFNYQEAALNRDQYIDKINRIHQLKKIGFNYEKNKEHIHQIFTNNGGSINKAIRNAKKLTKNGLNNPSTGVFLFGEYFEKYMNKD